MSPSCSTVDRYDFKGLNEHANHQRLAAVTVAHGHPPPQGSGIVSVRDWHLEVAPASEHWRELLAHYAGSVTVITLLLLFVLILPLAG
ncbi:hypothetical protein EVAR_87774_1 [Eumeta japonica]|uniref:Uncharacterized protein n=1 Tax=Eumeta variegata TaxID=151549 RepID=A0A4C1X7F0_EUMVA|nr:hypothetical protein EVAR_87774_1 [Eumeta japonica]